MRELHMGLRGSSAGSPSALENSSGASSRSDRPLKGWTGKLLIQTPKSDPRKMRDAGDVGGGGRGGESSPE